jgi:uncharacterized protein (TIGR03066 family)
LSDGVLAPIISSGVLPRAAQGKSAAHQEVAMRTMRFYLVVPFLLGLTVALGAEARDDKKVEVSKEKLVGVWEAVKGELPRTTTLEFTRDGKIKLALKSKMEMDTVAGTYVIEGDSLKMVLLIDGKEVKETFQVVKLSATELILKDDRNLVDELIRVSPEKK